MELESTSVSSASTAPIVAQASAADRAAFISKTYAHLFLAIAAFAGLEVMWFATPLADSMLKVLMLGRFAWLAFMAAFVGVSYYADKWALSTTSKGMQYAGLGLYTLFESILFVPLIALAIALAADGQPAVLPRAILITLTLFGCLTGIVFVTRKDFVFLRSALMFGGLAAFGLCIVSLLFGFTLGLFFSYTMVALACGYILYDTSNVMLRYRTNQHVAASLALFAAVMLLFWYVLRIFLSRRR
ncbi:MAG TPA: Bax inhibitor-1 family protein [Polyangiales bacterium]